MFRSIVRLNRGENRTLFAWRISASAFYLFARSCKSPKSKRRPASTARCSKNCSPAGFSQRIAPWCSTDRLDPSSSARPAPSMMKTDATMAARRVEASSITSEMVSSPKTAYTLPRNRPKRELITARFFLLHMVGAAFPNAAQCDRSFFKEHKNP